MKTPGQSFVINRLAALGGQVFVFLQYLSSVTWFTIAIVRQILSDIRHGRVPFRRNLFFEQTYRVGVLAIPLVAVVSLFLGLTTALLTGYQLKRYGTETLVPGLVAISFTRELGALLTGIVIAARSGAAYTAELSTMTVSEEVDAIEAMGIGAFRYLIVPRVVAIFLLVPCLTVISNIAALSGAAFISNIELGMSYSNFVDLALKSLFLKDVIAGIGKSLLFGLLIGVIACYEGLTVEGGAVGVGLSTTSSVVTSIGTVIGFDMVCNLVFSRVLT